MTHIAFHFAPVDPDQPIGIHDPKLPGDVGWDLVAMETVTIPPFGTADVPVNARMALPSGVWAEIRARSSIARRNLQVEAGVIDQGYRGPLFVLIRNMTLPPHLIFPLEAGKDSAGGDGTVTIQKGERVGQVVFHMIRDMMGIEVEQISEKTARGSAGFGSTGLI